MAKMSKMEETARRAALQDVLNKGNAASEGERDA